MPSVVDRAVQEFKIAEERAAKQRAHQEAKENRRREKREQKAARRNREREVRIERGQEKRAVRYARSLLGTEVAINTFHYYDTTSMLELRSGCYADFRSFRYPVLIVPKLPFLVVYYDEKPFARDRKYKGLLPACPDCLDFIQKGMHPALIQDLADLGEFIERHEAHTCKPSEVEAVAAS